MSRVMLTNTHMEHKSSLRELSTLLGRLDKSRLFDSDDFPNSQDQLIAVPDVYKSHAERTDSPYLNKAVGDALLGYIVPNGTVPDKVIGPANGEAGSTVPSYQEMKVDALRLDASKDLWCIAVDQFWMEFIGVPSSKNRPVPFMESFPVTMWLARPLVAMPTSSKDNNTSSDQSKSSSTDDPRKQSQMNGDIRNGEGLNILSPDSLGKSCSNNQTGIPQEFTFQGDVSQVGQDQDQESVSSSQGISVLSKDDKNESLEIVNKDKLSDLHLLFQIGSRVSLQLNHFQYLFLMRLIESILKYQAEIDEDTEFILKTLGPPKKIAISLVIDELEIALVCPPLRELPSLQRNRDDEDSTDDKDQDDIPEEAAKVGEMAANAGSSHAMRHPLEEDGTLGIVIIIVIFSKYSKMI